MPNLPLYQLDPLNRFSDRAANYANYRPSYPTEAIDQLLLELGEPSQLIAADIGAGTGISSRLLANWGVNVWAIEPNSAMSAAAEAHPNVKYRQASAERTGLPNQSVDLVTCFQSFHWFEPDTTLAEFHRILRSSGRLALVWNNRDLNDLLTQEVGEIMRKASDKHPALDRPEFFPENPNFINVQEFRFLSQQALDQAGLIGNAKSRSYVPQAGAAYEQLLVDLKDLYERWADDRGFVYLKYQTKVFLASPQTV